ncbi:MAG: hypothetical protein ACK5Z0_05660 [Planctomycetota bacterium]|jgi:hypothetical protein
MSTVRLLVRAANGNWSGIVPSRLAFRSIASLSADPASFEDLQAAVRRFVGYPPGSEPLAELVPGDWDTPHDRGIVVLDLVARMVVADSSFGQLSREGEIFWLECEEPGEWETTDTQLSFELADDWLLSDQTSSWRELAEERRAVPSLLRFEFRKVLYGRPLYEYVAMRVWDAYREAQNSGRLDRSQPPVSAEGYNSRGQIAEPDEDVPPLERFDFRGSNAEWAIIKQLHIDWLLTPRTDLRENSPREIALAGHNQIAADLEDQSRRWTLLDTEPPAISFDSEAYRYSSFGTHEWVQYYDFVRELLWNSWFRLTASCSESSNFDHEAAVRSGAEDRAAYRQAEISRLAIRAEEWLDIPMYGPDSRTPREIIERERIRLPEIEKDHHAAFDDDCPVCEMLRQSPGPIFWQLDGCHFDDDFAFDHYCESEEEWREKQVDWQRFMAKVKQDD